MAEAEQQIERTPQEKWAAVGARLSTPVVAIGDMATFFFLSITAIFRPPYRFGLLFTQLENRRVEVLYPEILPQLMEGEVLPPERRALRAAS